MVSIKLLAKDKLGTSEVEYCLKLSEYLLNLVKMVMMSHNKRNPVAKFPKHWPSSLSSAEVL